jgi:hypothetical protein
MVHDSEPLDRLSDLTLDPPTTTRDLVGDPQFDKAHLPGLCKRCWRVGEVIRTGESSP